MGGHRWTCRLEGGTSWLFSILDFGVSFVIFWQVLATMMSVFMYFGSLLPVNVLQKTPEYEKYTVPSTKNFLPLFMAAPLGDKSFLPYYHRIPHIVLFSGAQINNKAAS